MVDLGRQFDDDAWRPGGPWLVLGVASATGDDDGWSLADGVGAIDERTTLEVSRRALGRVEGLPPPPREVLLVGLHSSCVARVGDDARVDLADDGSMEAEVALPLRGCPPPTDGGWAPIGLTRDATESPFPTELRLVGATRTAVVVDGEVVRGEDPLAARITAQPTAPPADAPDLGAAALEGWVDRLEGVTPAVVTVFAGGVHPHAPADPDDADPCLDEGFWELSTGQPDAEGKGLVTYAPKGPRTGDFELRGGLVFEDHVQLIYGDSGLDLAVLMPADPSPPGDPTYGFATGHWTALVVGHHHDEDVVMAQTRLGSDCGEP